jgi:hypothetical protein
LFVRYSNDCVLLLCPFDFYLSTWVTVHPLIWADDE